jgi:hypothetical protein
LLSARRLVRIRESRSRVDANVQPAGAWMQWFNEPTATVNLTNYPESQRFTGTA